MSKALLALNIETQPDPARIDMLPAPDVKVGNLKDPAKIAAKQKKAIEQQQAKMALDPMFGMILCVTFAYHNEAGEFQCVTKFQDKTVLESVLLKWIWKQIDKMGRALVTFNGAGFDIPFLTRRSLLHNIKAPVINCNKYRTADPFNAEHIDVMQVLHQSEIGFGQSNPLSVSRNLAYYAQMILGEAFPYPDVDQSDMSHLDQSIPKGICEWNTTRTLALATRIRGS
jgi:hypothetical protein